MKRYSDMDAEEQFDYHYGVFKGRPWYDETKYQWTERGSDDDGLRRALDRMLHDLARGEGFTIPPQRCWKCDCDLPDDNVEGECDACRAKWAAQVAANKQREEAQRHWYESLSPEERSRVDAENREMIRLAIGGLTGRDVQ